ncbi:hypothetical protein VNO80_22165 [Phaseolus coccineus]|uniref:Uncharacterized protein n=1 Tax=Phaseolus coccineus TaxID=3886 RepID=A0AAN9QU07_PHACN
MLEEIAKDLLNDSQVITASDEKSLMTRVNSLCCLLQTDPAAMQSSSHDKESVADGPDDVENILLSHDLESSLLERCFWGQALGMSRKDSFGEFLLHLPRIASLSKFLLNISEEDKPDSYSDI